MILKPLIYLIRLKLLRLILNNIFKSRKLNGKNTNSMSVLAYLLELGISFLITKQGRRR